MAAQTKHLPDSKVTIGGLSRHTESDGTDTMSYLTNILADFQDRLHDISKINGVNRTLIEIFQSNLKTIGDEVKSTGKFGGLLQKIERYEDTLSKIERHPELADNFNVLREQSVVLMVSAFEVFVGDTFREIANNDPDYFVWPDKDKKIHIDIENFTASFTLGDAIISHLDSKQYSFQDLGSTVKAVNDYLGVSIDVETSTRQSISFGTSCRHIIVHNNSIVDKQFLNQTRDIQALKYRANDRLVLSESEVTNIKDALVDFSEYLTQALIQRDEIEGSKL